MLGVYKEHLRKVQEHESKKRNQPTGGFQYAKEDEKMIKKLIRIQLTDDENELITIKSSSMENKSSQQEQESNSAYEDNTSMKVRELREAIIADEQASEE